MKHYRIHRYRKAARPHLKYVVNFKVNGKRCQKFFETKGEAETWIELKEIEHKNQGKEGAEFPSWLRVQAAEANEILKPHGKSILDAAKFYAGHLASISKSVTINDLIKKFQVAKKSDGVGKRYRDDLAFRLPKFAESFGERIASTITTPEVNEWLRGLPYSPTSRNNYRRVVGVMFSFAVPQYIAANPVSGTARATVIDKDPEVMAIDQAAWLLATAHEDLVAYIAIGCFAGLRVSEIDRLHWETIDLEADLIQVVSKSRTARKRFVKILPNLKQWLLMIPVERRKGSVRPPNTRKLLEAARKEAGILEWPDNGMRHSFASYHLAHFKNAAALALEMGHTDETMVFEHYRQLVRPDAAAKYWSIIPADASRPWKKRKRKIVPMAV